MSTEKLKYLWRLITTKGQWALLVLAIPIVAYYFGAFGPLATGYFWYDFARFRIWLYGAIIIPAALIYSIVGFGRWILSLLPETDEDVPRYVRDLRHQCFRFDDRIDGIAKTNQNLIARVQQLEAKLQVICSLLRNDEHEKLSSDVLEDG